MLFIQSIISRSKNMMIVMGPIDYEYMLGWSAIDSLLHGTYLVREKRGCIEMKDKQKDDTEYPLGISVSSWC